MRYISKFLRSARRYILSSRYSKKKVMSGQIPLGGPRAEKTRQVWYNLPDDKIKGYLDDRGRSEYLHRLIVENCYSIKNNNSMLEIGTNVGRNLNRLYENGFSNLHGIEINERAVKMMKESYPNLQVNLLVGPVEDKIKLIKNKQISLTFTMAVLMHINPESHFIFKEIDRITKDYIITIEKEHSYDPPSIFPRDYQKIFTDLGWKQVFTEKPQVDILGKGGYVTRIFSK